MYKEQPAIKLVTYSSFKQRAEWEMNFNQNIHRIFFLGGGGNTQIVMLRLKLKGWNEFLLAVVGGHFYITLSFSEIRTDMAKKNMGAPVWRKDCLFQKLDVYGGVCPHCSKSFVNDYKVKRHILQGESHVAYMFQGQGESHVA